MSIKPIETHYKGYRFRSRTEARWAIFFDNLPIEWEYEKEGFSLEHGCYLPDFWIPCPNFHQDGGYWVEIKGKEPSKNEWDKCMELAIQTGHTTIIISGSPQKNIKQMEIDRKGDIHCGKYYEITYLADRFLTGQGIYDGLNFPKKAVNASKFARFEYGEKP